MAFANYSQQAKEDLAVSLSVLLLGDGGAEISAANINAVLAAAGVTGVKPYWGMLFAKIMAGRNLDDMLLKPGMGGGGGGGGGGAPAPAAGGAAAGGAKEEKKKEEKKEEEEEVDMGGAGGLFGGGDVS
jgi:large subunit ribosomal protein LP1